MKDIFITNNTKVRFLDKLKNSLNKCNRCLLSVSFIKKAGLVLFENEFEEMLKRGAKVKIITSTFEGLIILMIVLNVIKYIFGEIYENRAKMVIFIVYWNYNK